MTAEQQANDELPTRKFARELADIAWLTFTEAAGGRRAFTAVAVALWCAGIAAVCWLFATSVPAEVAGLMPALAAGAFITLVLVPLVGAGGGYSLTGQRLAPYPVTLRSHALAGTLSALSDLAVMLLGPTLFGLSLGIAGPAGAALTLLFLIAAVFLGQLSAWLSVLLASVRRWPTIIVLAGGTAIIAIFDLAPVLWERFTTSPFQPGAHYTAGVLAAADGQPELAIYAAIGLGIAPLIVWPVLLRLVAFVLVHDTRQSGPGAPSAHVGRVIGWLSPTFALAWVWLLSMVRAANVRLMLVAVAFLPAFIQVEGPVSSAQMTATLAVIGGLAVFGVATSVGVNLYSFAAGGTIWLLTAPISRARHICAQLLALGVLVIGALTYVLTVGTLLSPARPTELLAAIGGVGPFTLVAVGMGLAWSAKHPTAADHDSLRTRGAPLRATATFVLSAGLLAFVLLAVGSVLPAVATMLGVALTLTYAVAAAWSLSGPRRERIAATVSR